MMRRLKTLCLRKILGTVILFSDHQSLLDNELVRN